MCSEPGVQNRYRNNQPSTALANLSLSFSCPCCCRAQCSVSCPLTAPRPSWAPPKSASLFNQPSLKFPGSGKTVVLSSCLHNFLLPFPSFNPSFLLCLLILCWRLNQGPHRQATASHSYPESLSNHQSWVENQPQEMCAYMSDAYCLLISRTWLTRSWRLWCLPSAHYGRLETCRDGVVAQIQSQSKDSGPSSKDLFRFLLMRSSPDWTKPVQAIDINLLSSNSIGLKQRCLDLSVTVPGQIAESNDSSQRDTWS